MSKFEYLNVYSMKRVFFVISYSLIVICSSGQTINQKLQKALPTPQQASRKLPKGHESVDDVQARI